MQIKFLGFHPHENEAQMIVGAWMRKRLYGYKYAIQCT